MGGHRTYTDAAIEAALVATDRNNAAAARLLGCCSVTVTNYRTRIGDPCKVASGRPWSLTPAMKEEIATLREGGMVLSKIAAQVGCSVSAAQWTCSVLGVEHPTKPFVIPHRDPYRVSMRKGVPMRGFRKDEDLAVIELSLAGGTAHTIAKALKRAPSSVLSRMRTLARREEREMA